ncbi:hypothetical protein SynSYN20_01634 [Synechococcus sp. SYN20]|uniref:hypothetical protein n=1 Tax=Synechococcus sp. SYN20 TaxID=1050714 RepID=UPI0016455BFE|nr:hypothetical protein [Synechococcus sp. SYN20]QNJ25961.1 hypothetical protein SynSYN20_01634 [Synechococcus sp. SYN20]
MTTTVVLQALVVELIRRLWDRGLLSRTHRIAQMIHDNWFSSWVEYKTAKTMAGLDEQIEAIKAKWVDDDPWTRSETPEGETPLGGELRARHRAFDEEAP